MYLSLCFGSTLTGLGMRVVPTIPTMISSYGLLQSKLWRWQMSPRKFLLYHLTTICQLTLPFNIRVVSELQTRFKNFMETYDSTCIPTDLLPIAFQVAVRNGGLAEWEFTLKVYKDPSQVSIKTPAMFVSCLLLLTSELKFFIISGGDWHHRKTRSSFSDPWSFFLEL